MQKSTKFAVLLINQISQAQEEAYTCFQGLENCDWDSEYYNWLACDCFAQYQCEIGCMEGMNLMPTSICGECVDD